MAHGDAREEKWRGNWRMEWVASTLHTTLEHGVSSITTADAHTSADSSRLNWRPRRLKWTCSFRRKTKSGFCSCAITFQLASTEIHVENWNEQCECSVVSDIFRQLKTHCVGGRWMDEYGAMVEWYWQGKTEVLGEKHYTVWVVDGWMSMEQWWNDTDRGKLKYWEKNIIQCGW